MTTAKLTAAEALCILAQAGHTVSRNRKHAPGYQWAFDYRIDGEDVTLGRLRSAARAALAS